MRCVAMNRSSRLVGVNAFQDDLNRAKAARIRFRCESTSGATNFSLID